MHYAVQEVGTKQYLSLGKKGNNDLLSSHDHQNGVHTNKPVSRHRFLLRERGRWSRNNQSYDVITTLALVYGQGTKNCLNLRLGLFKERTDYV